MMAVHAMVCCPRLKQIAGEMTMKMISVRHGSWVVLLLWCCCCVGCATKPVTNPLDILTDPWVKMTVKYQAVTPTGATSKTVVISNATTLERLQKSLKISGAGGLYHIGTMTSNRVEISMESGQRIELYVINTTQLSMHDPDDRVESYSVDVTPTFVNNLKQALVDATGDTVRFESAPDKQGLCLPKSPSEAELSED
jgi:hypothetical protein